MFYVRTENIYIGSILKKTNNPEIIKKSINLPFLGDTFQIVRRFAWYQSFFLVLIQPSDHHFWVHRSKNCKTLKKSIFIFWYLYFSLCI